MLIQSRPRDLIRRVCQLFLGMSPARCSPVEATNIWTGSGARPGGARGLHFPEALRGRRRAHAVLRACGYKSRLQAASPPFFSSFASCFVFTALCTSTHLPALPHPQGTAPCPHSPDAFLGVGGCGACCGGTGLLHLGSGGPRNHHDRMRCPGPACAPRPLTVSHAGHRFGGGRDGIW